MGWKASTRLPRLDVSTWKPETTRPRRGELLQAVRERDIDRCQQLLRDHIDMTFKDARAR